MLKEPLTLVLILIAFLLPVAIIAGNNRCGGYQKNYWLVASMVFSWLALFLYFVVVPPRINSDDHH